MKSKTSTFQRETPQANKKPHAQNAHISGERKQIDACR
jgi:hypothetical protein